RSERDARVGELLEAVGIAPSRAGDRPARFSGGQLQRVVIARAPAAPPQGLLFGEPAPSPHRPVPAPDLNPLLALQKELNFASILVTHALAVAKVLSDDVLVLRHGAVVEQASADAFFTSPASDYSRHLLSMTFEPTVAGRPLPAPEAVP